jgi:hypothetical protein
MQTANNSTTIVTKTKILVGKAQERARARALHWSNRPPTLDTGFQLLRPLCERRFGFLDFNQSQASA